MRVAKEKGSTMGKGFSWEKDCEREDKKLKKGMLTKMWVTLICLMFGCGYFKTALLAKEPGSADEYLAETGMSVQEIGALDSDVRQFIADDLKNSDEKWEINTDIQTLTSTHSEQYTVAFYISVFSFRSESSLRVYAVYESSTEILATGNDSLSLWLGDGFTPYEYGGRVWYKKAGDGGWTPDGELAASYRTLQGGTFTGNQLGSFQRKMLVKGCVCCYAHEGEGDERLVQVEYTYDPPKDNNGTGLYVAIVTVTVIIVLILRGRE